MVLQTGPGLSSPEFPSPISQPTRETLNDWKLCDIGIYFERFQQFQTASFANSRGEYEAMKTTRDFVPSIQYFKGQDPSSLGANYE